MQSDSISLCAIQSQDNAGVRISGKRLSVCLNPLDGQYQCEYTRVGRWALVCGVHRSLTVLIGSLFKVTPVPGVGALCVNLSPGTPCLS